MLKRKKKKIDTNLKIDRQIEEIVLAFVPFINCSKQHLLAVLVGDILYHQGGSGLI